MEVNSWTNCYEGSWKDQIVPEAFSHPAKMAYGLLSRILTHAEEQGWLAPDSVILDPFGGISTTGILAAYRGYQCITCELEPKFTNLAMQNVKLHLAKWNKLKSPVPVIIQGDSRQLCSLVESADLIVSSPPFQGCNIDNNKEKGVRVNRNRQCVRTNRPENVGKGQKAKTLSYGQTPGQLGAMKPGKVDVVISSPPYAECLSLRGGRQRAQAGVGNAKAGKDDMLNKSNAYSGNSNNLGNLKAGDVSLILSSPPYEGSDSRKPSDSVKHRWKGRKELESLESMYDGNKDNLGNQQGDTFWAAAKEILEQCFQILRPGGHAIFVCKDFVRKGKRVQFSDDWQRLCESVGFTLCCRHRAMLVKEETHPGLFGADITKTTERKSFFRRLAEAKGSPRIDHEDVICMSKE